jgi:hypothetical protein
MVRKTGLNKNHILEEKKRETAKKIEYIENES